MSTRGCYRFSDGSNQGPFTVYKHSDNYPEGEHGGVAAIAKALNFAWPLPRFEADEFAAAFVAANKPSYQELLAEWTASGITDPESYAKTGVGGGVRLMNTPDALSLEHLPGDIEYLYDITQRGSQLWVRVSETEGGWGAEPLTATLLAEGTLAEMLERFRETRE